MNNSWPQPEGAEAVFILAPTFKDSSLAVDVLNTAGIKAFSCKNLDDLTIKITQDCGAFLISEEAVIPEQLPKFQAALAQQEPWSDIPIILLTSADIVRATEVFSQIGNISLLERPFSQLTLIRSVEVALRARRKQYQVRHLLDQLQKAKVTADLANFAKTEFLANMSHEIRTPIGAILGFTDLMKDPKNTAEDNFKFRSIVERNSQQLLRLIDDILDLSKVEVGKMSMENVQFSLTDLLADFVSIFKLKAAEKSISFQVKLESEIPDQIFSDPVRLKQILSNIVGNALKFTEKGFVRLTIEYKDETLYFSVTDSGIGLTDQQKEKLFKPFAQADTTTTRKFGGTGLGLVLSRRLAEALGGGLELTESQYQIGTTFSFNIKAKRGDKAKLVSADSLFIKTNPSEEETNQAQVLQGLNVLVVEDSLDNQMLIDIYLQNLGAHINAAYDGREGVESALKNSYDVVLMDVQMPHMDGHQAARKLRSLGYNRPIVALTAHAMSEERAKCIDSGFNDFLTKPVQRDLLVDTLARYLPKSSELRH